MASSLSWKGMIGGPRIRERRLQSWVIKNKLILRGSFHK